MKRVGFNLVQGSSGGPLGAGLKRFFGKGTMVLAMAAVSAQAQAATVITHWTMPRIAVEEADRPDQPNVFNTVAVPVRAKPTSTRWTKLMKASLDQPALLSLTADARALPPKEQVAYVQSMMSYALHNRPASYHCSDDGYWAAAGETLARGMGDCIDIAVAKMEALRLLGIPQKDLYLTTGYVGRGTLSGKGRETAALLVRIDDSFWLLPEQSEQIIEAGATVDASPTFTPMMTYGVGMTWVHGRLVKKTAMLGE